MDADPTEQCYGAEDSTYWVRTSPFAALLGTFYIIAVPLLLGTTFARYHEAIEKDQIRAMEHETEGQSWRKDLSAKRIQANVRGVIVRRRFGTHSFYSRKTKIHDTTLVRKHYGKLYEDFRPHLYWWRIVQMIRKVLLTLCIFLPASAPVFQASVAILILFISFVAQAKYSPYLSRPSHPIALQHKDKSQKGEGSIVGLFSGGNKSLASVKRDRENYTNHTDDDDLARKRWKKAIMITRVQVRWHHRVKKHTKDTLTWLFDYNSLEMMALSCAIVVLLNGIMLETNSLRAPILGVLKIASDDVTLGFVQFIDSINLALFCLPCVLLPFSILADIQRNIAFAIHNRRMKSRRREVAAMASRANVATRNAKLSAVEKWREFHQEKLNKELAQLDSDNRAFMQVIKEEYEDDRSEKEQDLRTLMKNRLTVQEFLKTLRQSTPTDAIDAQRLNADLQKTTAALNQCDKALLDLQEEMSQLDAEYRQKSSQKQHQYIKHRQELVTAFQKALKNQLEGVTNNDKKNNVNPSSNLPVQLQMKVLVAQRKFDDKHRHITVVQAELERIKQDLSPSSLKELEDREELVHEILKIDESISEEHVIRQLSKAKKLESIEDMQKDLFTKQKHARDTLHEIDMEAEANRRALEKQLSPEEYTTYMHAVELSRKRREKLAIDEKALKKEDRLSDQELEDRLRSIRQAADDDISAYMSVVDKNKRDKHARLIKRLARVKEKEARLIQETNLKAAGGESLTNIEVEARIHAIQVDTDARCKEILAEAGQQSSSMHNRLLKRLADQKKRLANQEEIAKMQSKLDGKSQTEIEVAIDAVRASDTLAEESLIEDFIIEETQSRNAVLSTVASLKEAQGEQLFKLMKAQHSNIEQQMTAGQLSDEMRRLNEESDTRIQQMLKSVGIAQDKKHRRMLEKIAERKAKQVAQLADLQQKREEAVKACLDTSTIDADIAHENREAAMDIAELTSAIANRHDNTQNKTHKRLLKLIDLAAAHDAKCAEHDKLEAERKALIDEAEAIEKAHEEEKARMNARHALKKEKATEKLNARLQRRRQKKLQSLRHDSDAVKKYKDESKKIKRYSEHVTKLESLEDEVAKISAEFASHVEAQTRAMENEKMRQHQNIAERRRRALERRRKHGEINSKKYNDSGNMKKNMDHSSMESKTAQLSVMVEEINKSLDMAKQRMVMGRPWEDQLHALIADIKQIAAHQNTVINNGPSRINAPAISVDRPRLSLNQSSSTMAMKRNKEI